MKEPHLPDALQMQTLAYGDIFICSCDIRTKLGMVGATKHGESKENLGVVDWISAYCKKPQHYIMTITRGISCKVSW